jgi:hypothetical protein
MLKTGNLLIYAFILIGSACTNMTTRASGAGDAAQSTAPASKPSDIDLLDALQGKWKSEQDSGYIIEIAGNKILHYTGDKFSFQSEIEVDANCTDNACKVGQDTLTEGWCFIEKGQFDAQCNKVLKCDKQLLRIKAVGVENGLYSFKKL